MGPRRRASSHFERPDPELDDDMDDADAELDELDADEHDVELDDDMDDADVELADLDRDDDDDDLLDDDLLDDDGEGIDELARDMRRFGLLVES
jgi:hypothetical protein